MNERETDKVRNVSVTIFYKDTQIGLDGLETAMRVLASVFGDQVEAATIEVGPFGGEWLVTMSRQLWERVVAAGELIEVTPEFEIVILAEAR